MMNLACLITFGIAFASYEIGIHLSDEAEGMIVLALVTCLVFGLLSLIFLPWFLKAVIVLALLISKVYLPASRVRR